MINCMQYVGYFISLLFIFIYYLSLFIYFLYFLFYFHVFYLPPAGHLPAVTCWWFCSVLSWEVASLEVIRFIRDVSLVLQLSTLFFFTNYKRPCNSSVPSSVLSSVRPSVLSVVSSKRKPAFLLVFIPVVMTSRSVFSTTHPHILRWL